MGDTEKKPDSEVSEESKPIVVEETKASEAGLSSSDKALAAKTDGKANNKSPKKSKSAEAELAQAAEEEASGSEEEDEEEEPRLGLLEQPVLIESGKRERKKVERLSEQLSAAVSPSDRKSLLSLEGSGEKLGDCPEIESELRKQGPDDLKTLHRILYGRSGAVTEVKRNIRKFCGFTFGKESDEYNRKLDSLLRSTTNQSLKAMCAILAQERSGTKEQMAERILDFLLCPKSTGVRPRKSRAGRKGRKPKSNDTKERKKRKSKASEQNDGQNNQTDGQLESDKSDDSDADTGKDDSKEDGDNGSNDRKAEGNASEGKTEPKTKESPKKKAGKSPKKEKTPKAKKPRAVKEPKEPKAKVGRKPKTGDAKGLKVKVVKKRAKSGDGNSDDEPLLKKVKQEPSEDDLRKLIKKILDSANLEEVTMKTVIKKVFSEFPEADLTPKKDFIKETVKEILGA